MADAAYVLVAVAFFTLGVLYTYACGRL